MRSLRTCLPPPVPVRRCHEPLPDPPRGSRPARGRDHGRRGPPPDSGGPSWLEGVRGLSSRESVPGRPPPGSRRLPPTGVCSAGLPTEARGEALCETSLGAAIREPLWSSRSGELGPVVVESDGRLGGAPGGAGSDPLSVGVCSWSDSCTAGRNGGSGCTWARAVEIASSDARQSAANTTHRMTSASERAIHSLRQGRPTGEALEPAESDS